MKLQEKTKVKTAKILLHYYPKRARKARFKALTRSAETTQSAVMELEKAIEELRKENREVILKSTFQVFDSEMLGEIIMMPLYPESSNCNCVEYSTTEYLTHA